MFYNGWKSDHFVGAVLLFVTSCRIASAIFNAPGCMHDSQISESSGLVDKLENLFEKTSGIIVTDSAFDNMTKGYTVFQSSEWSMPMFQGSFPRMTDRFSCEERGERKVLMLLTILLFDLL